METSSLTDALPSPVHQAARVLRSRHYRPKTAKAYLHWIGRYLAFHEPGDPRLLHEPHVNSFLSHLALDQNVAASTQNQVLALLFFHEHVLGRPLDRVSGVVRARKPRRLPTVLSREEVAMLLPKVPGTARLVCLLRLRPAARP